MYSFRSSSTGLVTFNVLGSMVVMLELILHAEMPRLNHGRQSRLYGWHLAASVQAVMCYENLSSGLPRTPLHKAFGFLQTGLSRESIPAKRLCSCLALKAASHAFDVGFTATALACNVPFQHEHMHYTSPMLMCTSSTSYSNDSRTCDSVMVG